MRKLKYRGLKQPIRERRTKKREQGMEPKQQSFHISSSHLFEARFTSIRSLRKRKDVGMLVKTPFPLPQTFFQGIC